MLVAVLAGLAVSSATAATAVHKPSIVAGSGSDVMFHVSSALDLLYNESPGCTTIDPNPASQPLTGLCDSQPGDITTENLSHDRITELWPIGGSSGITQLCDQGLSGVAKINYVRQTSAPSSSACKGLNYVAFARDALTFETFPGATNAAFQPGDNQSGACAGSTDLCLTQAQLQGIFVNCTITNWSAVGGASAPIKIYTILPQFGTRKAWDTFLGGSSSSCAGSTLVDQTDNDAIPTANKPDAIVPVSVGSWNERYSSSPGGSALGDVDGKAPTAANISNLSFPFGRYLYNVYCAGTTVTTPLGKCGGAAKAGAAVTQYMSSNGWLCKVAGSHTTDPVTGLNYHTEIANTISQYGFVPLTLGATGGGTTTTNYCRLFSSGS